MQSDTDRGLIVSSLRCGDDISDWCIFSYPVYEVFLQCHEDDRTFACDTMQYL